MNSQSPQAVPVLTATPPTSLLTLEPPTPPAVVEPAQAEGMVKIDPTVIPELDHQVSQFVNDIVNMQFGTETFNGRVNDLHKLGQDAIAGSAAVSNRLMSRSVRAMDAGALTGKSGVGKSLIDLRQKMEELNPKRYGNMLEPRKIMGLIPFGSRLQDYFDAYRSADSYLSAILKDLAEGKDELIRDTADIEQEKQTLWDALQKLEQYVYIARAVDAKLAQRAAELDGTDPMKARVVREELLFTARQRVTDLLTQAAVSVQGYLSMDIIRKTNLELIRGVDRASSTTVSALRTAVITAQALGAQKMVLEQVKAVNATTENLIVATSEMVQGQSAEIYQQAASPTIAIEKMQLAFDNTFAAYDMVADFKVKSLDAMQQTVTAFAAQIDRAKQYTDRARQAAVKEVTDTGAVTPTTNIAHL